MGGAHHSHTHRKSAPSASLRSRTPLRSAWMAGMRKLRRRMMSKPNSRS